MKPPQPSAKGRAAWVAGLAILALAALKFGFDFTRPSSESASPEADELVPGGKVRTAREARASTPAPATATAPTAKVQPLSGSERACPFALIGIVRLEGPPPRPEAVLRYEPTGKLCRVTIGDALPGDFRLADVADDHVVLTDAKGRPHILTGRFAPHYGR